MIILTVFSSNFQTIFTNLTIWLYSVKGVTGIKPRVGYEYEFDEDDKV